MTYEERFLHHLENCPSCSFLDEHGHPKDCDGCFHPYHEGQCQEEGGDVPDERYKGGYVAVGCPCEGSETMTREQVEAEQQRHYEDMAEAAYDRAMDQKLSEWKERER